MLTEKQSHIIQSVLAPFEPDYIGVFGSYARGEQRADSDLDILVKFGRRLTYFDLIDLEETLSKQLGLKVDLVTENALSPFFRENVLREMQKIA